MNLNTVNEQFLIPNKLQLNDLGCLLGLSKRLKIDYADIYCQLRFYESWMLEDGIIKSGSYNINHGAGIRAIVGERTGFAYTNALNFDTLMRSMKAAVSIVDHNDLFNNDLILNKTIKYDFSEHYKCYPSIYSDINPLSKMSNEEKIALLMRIDKVARSEDSCVKRVQANLSGLYEYILVIATDGTLTADIRPLVRLSIFVQVERNGRREQGISGGGGRHEYNSFLNTFKKEDIFVDYWVRNAVRMGLINLESVEAPSGSMPVVLGPGWPGILIHEAVGHGLESDFNRLGSSVFSNKLGKKVASNLCTVVDNATLVKSRGSLSIDDEGVPGQYSILIKDGILQGYMQDKLNSRLMGVHSTGNGRRESYANLPIPRMTNTYMLPGKSTPGEIIDTVNYGVYASNFGGGQVDITSGKFVFSTSEAFLIEKGRITKPIKNATLIGSGSEIMQNISMIGNDLSLDSGMGICVKNGQQIPVSVGQPTVKLRNITVGGTK